MCSVHTLTLCCKSQEGTKEHQDNTDYEIECWTPCVTEVQDEKYRRHDRKQQHPKSPPHALLERGNDETHAAHDCYNHTDDENNNADHVHFISLREL